MIILAVAVVDVTVILTVVAVAFGVELAPTDIMVRIVIRWRLRQISHLASLKAHLIASDL